MKCRKAGHPVILLIHGLGCTGEHSFLSSVHELENDYRVVVVCLDGYDSPDITFTTIYDQAEKIANYVAKEYGGLIHTILGMSIRTFEFIFKGITKKAKKGENT